MNRNGRSLIRAAAVSALTLAPVVASAQLPASRAVVRDYAAEAACAARSVGMPPDTTIRVGAGRERGKSLFGDNDALVITAGTSRGLKVGQEYFVRRIVPDRFVPPGPDGLTRSSVHTAGWVRIVDAQSDSAIATVTKLCDGIQQGDYLEPFEKPVLSATSATPGEPDFANPGHLVMGDDRRQMAAKGDLLVLDRGSDHGLRGGQRLTIFRPTAGGTGPIARIAEATAVLVSPETTVIRIDKTTDAVYVGDLVAIHR